MTSSSRLYKKGKIKLVRVMNLGAFPNKFLYSLFPKSFKRLICFVYPHFT